MNPQDVEDIYPLAPAQKGVLFHALLNPAGSDYFNQFAATVPHALVRGALVQALAEVTARHATLRTSCHWEELEAPLQVVHHTATVPVRFEDLRALPEAERSAWEQRFLDADRAEPLAIDQAPLWRVCAADLGASGFRLLVSYHHILFDAWSMHLVMEELLHAYADRCESPDRPAKSLERAGRAPGYRDFVSYLERQDADAEQRFWQGRLAGFEGPSALPGDPDPAALPRADDTYAEQRTVLSREGSDALRALARAHRVPLNLLFRAAWAVLSSRATGERDVVVGVTHSGRTLPVPGLQAMVGLVLTTVPERIQVEPSEPIGAWLTRLQARSLEAEPHIVSPLVDLQSWSAVPRGTPLFETLMVFGVDARPFGAEDGLHLEAVVEREQSGYPLTWVIHPGEEIEILLAYNERRFGRSATGLLSAFAAVLGSFAANPGARVGALSLCTAEERRKILVDWSAPTAPVPGDALVHGLFEAQVARTPDAVALEFASEQRSYRDLEAAANRMAGALRARGVGPEVRVALVLSPGLAAITAMLAVLKAGGAYIPLDPEAPEERLRFMLADAHVHLVLTAPGDEARFTGQAAHVLAVDSPVWSDGPSSRPSSSSHPANLAYVVYTSGTSGEPKGVEVTHASVVNHNVQVAARFALGPLDRVLQFTPLHFDAAVEEIFPALASGATVVVRGDLIPTSAFSALITSQSLNVLSMPPAYVHEWLLGLEARRERVPSRLRLMLMGGEAILPETLTRWNALGGRSVRLINVYGPSEATVTSALYELTEGLDEAVLPIGRPLENARCYVLDDALSPVPPGFVGELYIAGLGLARGYAGKPALTADRFLPDPFASVGGARMYRTGDLAELLPDGRMVFRGRADRQVKIRGIRIEPAEVEAVLLKHPAVHEVVVTVRVEASGEKRLVAYVTTGSGTVSAALLREHVSARMPTAFVPSAIVTLERLPLTANGKIDFRALPAPPSPGAGAAMDAGRTPRTALEASVCEVFRDVLGVPALGIDDDFFELGGQSILAMRVVSRLRSELGREVPLRALFDAPTVATLSARLAASPAATPAPALKPVLRGGNPAPASFAQEQLFFIHQLDPKGLGYSIPIKLALRGMLDVPALSAALDAVVVRHEVLRSTLAEQGGQVVQRAHPPRRVLAPLSDLTSLPSAEREATMLRLTEAESQRPFDLGTGPLFRAQLFRMEAERHVLLLVFHHTVFDGASARILLEELATGYESARRGEAPALPPLPIQYADFAAWQRQRLTAAELAAEVEGWKQRLAGAPHLLELPLDHPRSERTGRNGRIFFELPQALSDGLRRVARQEHVSLFSLATAALGLVLSRAAQQDDFLIGTELSTRSRQELEGLIGIFVNTVPLRLRPGAAKTVRELMQQTHRVALEAFEHGEIPFHRIVEAVNPERNLKTQALTQVILQFDNVPASAQSLAGLSLEEFAPEEGEIQHDLLVGFADDGVGALNVTWNYSADLFEARTAARMKDQLVAALEAFLSPELALADLSLCSNADRERIRARWAPTARAAPVETLVHELFEAQVRRTPEATAVELAGASDGGALRWTFAELEAAANRCAAYLQTRGVAAEARVGVLMEPSLEALAAFYGVLKAGGAYVPLDPGLPAARLGQMLELAGISEVLTHRDLGARLPPDLARTTDVAGLPEGTRPGSWAQRPSADALAYVVFTSGTTGEPKGVAVSHRALVNHNLDMARRMKLAPGDRMLQFTPLAFDAAGEEIYPPLLAGSTVVIRATDLRYDEFSAFIRDQRLTVLSLPPAFQHEWLGAMERAQEQVPATLRLVLLGGERIHPDSLATWNRLGGADVAWMNAYGPTEATVTAAVGVSSPTDAEPPALDAPLDAVRIHLLDEAMRVVPVGQPGLVYIAGAGLARGYLKRPGQTAEAFVPDPFGPPGSRMYRTGDLGRLRENLGLDILGRADHQVKLRGKRIELGEIDAVLERQPGVRASLTLLRDDLPGGAGLVAYVILAEGATARPVDLREACKASLPDYMVPTGVVSLARFPLTANGKIDRKAFPAPDLQGQLGAQAGGGPFKAPRSRLEKRLAALWEELLGVSPLGVDQSFFDVGGHSLLGMRMLSDVDEEFHVDLPINVLFDDPTIEGLARALADALSSPEARAPRAADAPARSPLVVPLQEAGTRTPLFLIHDGIGTPVLFRHLAGKLDPDRPVHLVQSPLILGQPLPETLEGLVALYLEAIQTVRPQGPYLLGGFSFGCYVAYELGRKLLAAGEEVPRLLVLDSLGWTTLRNLPADDGVEPPADLKQLISRDFERPADDEFVATLTRYETLHRQLLDGHLLPPAYPGRVEVLATEGSVQEFGTSLGWELHAPGRVTARAVPGAAHAILEPSLATLVAAAMTRALDGA